MGPFGSAVLAIDVPRPESPESSFRDPTGVRTVGAVESEVVAREMGRSVWLCPSTSVLADSFPDLTERAMTRSLLPDISPGGPRRLPDPWDSELDGADCLLRYSSQLSLLIFC